ncbi:Rossmann-like and DUF2520 domain-containing protein [Acuticoccus sediminis]|uniref:Rossmann-like and DUF2520 domain-containing protein n=1 Tax=Acuticoccus sediminis TaxID=2184697 RepID=UPI001CFEEC29|nr:DUF2520 domain-containing protein [Acuticoccus sediminis]
MAALTLNLVGPGRVGQTIFRRLVEAGQHTVQDIAARSLESAERAAEAIGAGRATTLGEMRAADVWFITVSDTKTTAVAEALARSAPGPAIAVHCSGFLSSEALAPLGPRGWSLASAHPVLTFADPAVAVTQFPGSYCGIEGDETALATVRPLLEGIGARCFPIRSETKALYHGAAVMANNFAIVLQALGREAWADSGVPADILEDLHAAILRPTVENVLAMGPAAALTGPASRNDWDVVTRQHQAVADWNPEAGQAYESLSVMARRLKHSGSTRIRHPEED